MEQTLDITVRPLSLLQHRPPAFNKKKFWLKDNIFFHMLDTLITELTQWEIHRYLQVQKSQTYVNDEAT